MKASILDPLFDKLKLLHKDASCLIVGVRTDHGILAVDLVHLSKDNRGQIDQHPGDKHPPNKPSTSLILPCISHGELAAAWPLLCRRLLSAAKGH